MHKFNRRMFFLTPDGGGGGAGGEGDPKPDEIKDFGEWLKGQPESVQKAFESHTHGLKSALEAERKAVAEAEKAKKAEERERQKAAEQALAEQSKFKELAAEREKRIAAIEPELETAKKTISELTAKLAESDAVLGEILEAQTKAIKLDDATRDLLAGKTPIEQLRWIAKHGEKLGKRGLPTTPDEGASGGSLSAEEAAKLTTRTW